MKILVTGAAGFIGAAVCRRLLENGYNVTGIDNINGYYSRRLKTDRLARLGVASSDAGRWNSPCRSSLYPGFLFRRMNLEDKENIIEMFKEEKFDMVAHFGAQAGVRYSVEKPDIYIKSNIEGFLNILEGCRAENPRHLLYASSSSVYGLNAKAPFSESQPVSHPVSLYAATKKSVELMAHVYSHLYNIPTTGLRFFTVYGPWGRPDMSPLLFIDAILSDRPVKVFNNGELWRDFTYIDDVVESVARILMLPPKADSNWDPVECDQASSSAPYRIYNVGNQNPVKLIDYINCIERILGREARKVFMPMQPGDVYQTFSDSSALAAATGFRPSTDLEEGLRKTIDWFRHYRCLSESE